MKPVIAATSNGASRARVGRAGRAQAQLGQPQVGGVPARDLLARARARRVPSSASSVKATWRIGSLGEVRGEHRGHRAGPLGDVELARREVEHQPLEPLDLLARGEQQRLLEQLLLGVEPVGGGGQRHARRARRDGAVRDGVGAVLADQLERRAQDVLAPSRTFRYICSAHEYKCTGAHGRGRHQLRRSVRALGEGQLERDRDRLLARTPASGRRSSPSSSARRRSGTTRSSSGARTRWPTGCRPTSTPRRVRSRSTSSPRSRSTRLATPSSSRAS